MTSLKEYEEAGWSPDLHGWYQLGVDMNATHMVISFDDGFYPPSYAIPGVETVERVEHSCEYIHGTYDLSKPLTQEEIDRFYEYYW